MPGSKNWYQNLKTKKKKVKPNLERKPGWQATSNWEHLLSNELVFKPGQHSKLDWDDSSEASINSVVYAQQNHRLLYFLATLSSTLIIICVIFSILFYAVSERRVPRGRDDTEDDSADEIEESILSKKDFSSKEQERIPAVSNDIPISCSSLSTREDSVAFDAESHPESNSGKKKWLQDTARKVMGYFQRRKYEDRASMTLDDNCMISLAMMSPESNVATHADLNAVADISQFDVVYLDSM